MINMPIDYSIDIIPYSEVVAEIDPSNGGSRENNSGYIKAIVIFFAPVDPDDITSIEDENGNVNHYIGDNKVRVNVIPIDGLDNASATDVSADVISLTTDQGSSKQEGDATAKMTVTLNNKNHKYANALLPQVTLVYSWIEVQRNEINGKQLKVITERFPLYFGRVQEVNINHETCTVDCGDESSVMEGSVEFDYTWFPTVPIEERVQDILDATIPPVHLIAELIISDDTEIVNPEMYTATSESGQSNISMITKSQALDWTVPSDQPFRLIICDSKLRSGTTDEDLTKFVIDPQDNESIVGHCNHVIVLGDGVFAIDKENKNVVASDSNGTWGEFKNDVSIAKYGEINARIYRFPWICTQEEAQKIAENIIEIYRSYEDRLITPIVASKIPMLNSYFHYNIIGGYEQPEAYKNATGGEEPFPRTIHVKVLRKRVTYDSASGVTCQLECLRRFDEIEEGGAIPSDYENQIMERDHDANGNPTFWYLFVLNPASKEVYVLQTSNATWVEQFRNRIYPVSFSAWNQKYTSGPGFPAPRWGRVVSGKLQ